MDVESDNNHQEMEIDGVEDELPAVEVEQLTLETINMECLLLILDRLDSNSLMELSDVSDNFRNNICLYQHILSNKLFKFDELDDLMPVFTNFGQFIRKLEINEYVLIHDAFARKFNQLLDVFIKYLMPGNLTELTIDFGIYKLDREQLRSALPYFSNLKFLCFKGWGDDDYSRSQEYFLDEVIGNARQLKSLDIRNLRTAGKWYRFEHLINLEHLTFIFIDLIKYADFRQFIEKRPALKTVVLSVVSVHRQHLCRLVFRHLPNLKQFEIRNSYSELPFGDDFDFIAPFHETDEQEEEEDDDDNDQITEDGETTESADEFEFDTEDNSSDIEDVRDATFNYDHVPNWKRIYAGISGMNSMKKTWLKSHLNNCWDLYDVLKRMSNTNTVEHLTIQVGVVEHESTPNDDFMAEPFPKSFTALKTLRIVSPSDNTQSFLRHFICALPNMTTCILDMDVTHPSVQDTIANLVASAKNLEILALKLPAMNLDHLLYMKLIGIQYCKSVELSTERKHLQIYISSSTQKDKCLAELKDLYDEKTIAINVRSFCDWETNPI